MRKEPVEQTDEKIEKLVNSMLEVVKQQAHSLKRMVSSEQSQSVPASRFKVNEEHYPILEQLAKTMRLFSNNLSKLPPQSAEKVIESFLHALLDKFTPMAGRTVQQHNDKKAPLFAYRFAREATSGAVLAFYRDKKTKDFHVLLIRNKGREAIYNWPAGYTEAPRPEWLNTLYPKNLRYNREVIVKLAKQGMMAALKQANGDWTKINFDIDDFKKYFEGSQLPEPTHINSWETARQKLFEETGLDLKKISCKKTLIVDELIMGALGLSQGDAPGQLNNRGHQYLVDLGELDKPPELKIQAIKRVSSAAWVNVSDIQRQSADRYTVNGIPLCIYMLRSLELDIKQLWKNLLENISITKPKYGMKLISRFSDPGKVALAIEDYCDRVNVKLEGTRIPAFLKILNDLPSSLPSKTYTGRSAQLVLNALLDTTKYLMGKLKPESFIKEMDGILDPLYHLFPQNHHEQITDIFNGLPTNHKVAEYQATPEQRKISRNLVSGTPYLPFYEIFTELNNQYGPKGDFTTQYLNKFVRCRCHNILTASQKEFHPKKSSDWKKEGDIAEGCYPAAVIKGFNKFKGFKGKIAIGEGPFEHTFPTLLQRLKQQKIKTIIAAGPTEENGKSKFFNYIKDAEEISAYEYIENTIQGKNINIPEEFKKSMESKDYNIKFYCYKSKDHGDFYVMHIPKWADRGTMPKFNELEQEILGYELEYGNKNRFYHCSAGVGRSAAMVMMFMLYQKFKEFKNIDIFSFKKVQDHFKVILTAMKEVKPRAGEWCQLLSSVAYAEKIYNTMDKVLQKQNSNSPTLWKEKNNNQQQEQKAANDEDDNKTFQTPN